MKSHEIASPTLEVQVPLSENRGYQIHIGDGLLSDVGSLLSEVARGRRVVIISQAPIVRACAAELLSSLRSAGFGMVPILTFPAGERYKTLATVQNLYQKLYSLVPAIDRNTLLIALGGGVVGDVAGFVAASYLRGLPYVQVPTTLLAMVDSSVGGKTGVDFRSGKNLIGAFNQPRAVYIDPQVVNTLPEREFRSGMAEVVKYGVIADRELLADIVNLRFDRSGVHTLNAMIAKCCQIKANIVANDEFEETGLRATLNFGHTIGHALESTTQYRRFKHGEAIAIGMVAATHIGELYGITAPSVRAAVTDALVAQDLPICVPRDIAPDSILGLLSRDKKAVAGKARFVLPREIGDVVLVDDVDGAAVAAGLAKSYDSEQK